MHCRRCRGGRGKVIVSISIECRGVGNSGINKHADWHTPCVAVTGDVGIEFFKPVRETTQVQTRSCQNKINVLHPYNCLRHLE